MQINECCFITGYLIYLSQSNAMIQKSSDYATVKPKAKIPLMRSANMMTNMNDE